jgi:hypothetical protein
MATGERLFLKTILNKTGITVIETINEAIWLVTIATA